MPEVLRRKGILVVIRGGQGAEVIKPVRLGAGLQVGIKGLEVLGTDVVNRRRASALGIVYGFGIGEYSGEHPVSGELGQAACGILVVTCREKLRFELE